ncbi:hypothetical protein [Streptomyces bohaiensis]|uniref:Uncharacterized protein n=1 Tax=Streptomyces bohaiensis TaxID=1431344 RepID=A0ABX1CCT1_9ACTN|nr:hypothetical protein [Streptomyces bohaiensis]NJQ14119.1 hypothetical protein [Streptomyces bohaiensis]
MNQGDPHGYQWGPNGQQSQQPAAPPVDLTKGPYPAQGGYGTPQPNAQGGQPGPYAPGAYDAGSPSQAPMAPQGQQGAPLLYIGDITVMPDAILTPAGPMPLRGAVWTFNDLSRTEKSITTTGIVLACVFAVFCLLGLLFLLMREERTTGYIQVGVTSGGRHHSTMIPATTPHAGPAIAHQVAWLRSISA